MSEQFTNYHKHYERMGNVKPDFNEIKANIKHYVVFEQWLPQNYGARILDIGCGWGQLLLSLWASGYSQLSGVEISESQYKVAKEGLPPEISLTCGNGIDFISETNQQYDLITIFDVLEHLDFTQTMKLLLGCYNKLSPGGSVVVRVPNMANILSAYSRYLDITHINGHTEWSLLQLLDFAGFNYSVVIKPKWFNTTEWRQQRTLLKPWRGLGLRDLINTAFHEVLFTLRGQKPKPSTYAVNVLVQSWKDQPR